MTNTHMNGSAETAPKPVAKPRKRRAAQAKKPVEAAVPHAPTQEKALWGGFTRNQVFGWAMGSVAALVAAGWITLPAKQSDLEGVMTEMRAGFGRIEKRFENLDNRFQSMDSKIDAIRTDVVKLQTVQEIQAAPAPLPPPKPLRRQPKPETAKTTNIFGF